MSLNRRTNTRTLAIPIADDLRARALLSLLSVSGLALILSAGAAWLRGT